jgi:uncharacterized protein (TIGR02246 family)
MSKLLFVFLPVLAAWAQGPQPSAPAGVSSLLAAMNEALQRSDAGTIAALFSNDGDLRIGGRVAAGAKTIAERLTDRRPWSEVTPPKIENQSVRLVTPDVAIVDASWVQYGSTVVRRASPVLLVMKKDGERWQVVALRLGMPDLADRIPATDAHR